MLPGITWTCHICGSERPDAFISVYTTTVELLGTEVQQNVRYCNDQPECISGAPLHNLFPTNKEEDPS